MCFVSTVTELLCMELVFAVYASGIQPGVCVPPGVRKDILGGT
jgi:hypothetical protein